MARRKRIESTGGKRMLELGKHPVQLWLTADEHKVVSVLAREQYRPLTAFILMQLRPLIKEFFQRPLVLKPTKT